ncbi:uncharacterized, partial [Tachysurus ichikawai]
CRVLLGSRKTDRDEDDDEEEEEEEEEARELTCTFRLLLGDRLLWSEML